MLIHSLSLYRPLRHITSPHSLHHSSISFASSSGLWTPSFRKFLLGSFIHLFIGLPSGLLISGFQLKASFIRSLDLHTYPSQLIFLPLSVYIMSSSSHRSLISLLDLISYLPVLSFFLGPKMGHKNFLSRTANFLSSSFDIVNVSHTYRIPVLLKPCIISF